MASARQEIQRSQRVRKVSEAENDSKAKTNTIRVEAGNSMFYTKVPLNRIDTNAQSGGNAEQGNHSALTRAQASVRIRKMAAYHDGSSRFPKLNECAHFHYDNVEFGQVQVFVCNESDDVPLPPNHYYTVQVTCQKKKWILKRCYEDFRVLDKHLHRCIFDRRYSQLVELPKGEAVTGNHEAVRSMLSHYLSRFSQIAGNMINCAPVLNWMELDNHGNHLIVSDESAINIPAVAAAHVVKRYAAQVNDELTLEVGEIVSVIDMPPVEDTNWWRGKKGFEVGFFPSQCVQVIGGKVPTCVVSHVPKTPKPVLRKHGKLITFLRSFMLARPAKRRLKQRGILRERVYGCDLGEHLLNSEHDIPQVLKICTDFIETNGVVDGIYRLSGVASNIQCLRQEFDSEKDPDMSEYVNDIHCVSSVLKLYFRELPNPLLTYQLYDKFAEAIATEEDRLLKITDVIQQLPPPHYRTVEYLMKHLSKMSSYQDQTGMHSKNLAIVWAPNLLRSRQIETASMAFKKSKSREIETGLAAFMEIRVQSIVVEYLIRNVHMIFSDKVQSKLTNNERPDFPGMLTPAIRRARPKSLILSTPTKLLSLEEARARSGVQSVQEIPVSDRQKFIEVGGGPAALPKQYHTVIDLPYDRKKNLTGKTKKSPSGWKAFFRPRQGYDGKRKLQRKASVPPEKELTSAEKKNSLRSVRSAESLMSGSDTSEGAGSSLIYPDSEVSPRRSSQSSLPKATSHNSFFEGESALAAMATNAMATPPESMFAKPSRRVLGPQRQRSYSENPPVGISVDFMLGEVEFRKKRMRHSDTPIQSGSTGSDAAYAGMKGKSGPSRERYSVWFDQSSKALPGMMKMSNHSPSQSNRSSVSSQSSSSSPEARNGQQRVSVVIEDNAQSEGDQKVTQPKERRSAQVETTLDITEADSALQSERNSKHIDQRNTPGEEQKVPLITKTEPGNHETVTLNLRIPPYNFGNRIYRLPDRERVTLATEDNFRLTPYSTLESNVSLRDYEGNDDEVLKTPTTADNPFDLETVMSQFDSMRDKYLRQGTMSPVYSNSDDGTPSPQPEHVSPVFFESPGQAHSNQTYSTVVMLSDNASRSYENPTYSTVTVHPQNGIRATANPVSGSRESVETITDQRELVSQSVQKSTPDKTCAPEPPVSREEDSEPSIGQCFARESNTCQRSLPELSVTEASLAELSVEGGPVSSVSQRSVGELSSVSRTPLDNELEFTLPSHSLKSEDTASMTVPVPGPAVLYHYRVPSSPHGDSLSPSLSPTSPPLSSPSSTSPELQTPPPLPSPPSLHSPGPFPKFSTTNVFTFGDRKRDSSVLSPSSVVSNASYTFPTTLEISYASGSSSSASSRSTSSSVSPVSPRSPSSPVRPLVLPGPTSPTSPRSSSSSSTGLAEKPLTSPRKIPISPSSPRRRSERRGSQGRNPSPTDVAYAESDEKMKCVAAKLSTHHDDLAKYEGHKEPGLERWRRDSDFDSETSQEPRSPSYYENADPYDEGSVFTQEAEMGSFPRAGSLTEIPPSGHTPDDLPLGDSRLSVMTVISQYDNLQDDSISQGETAADYDINQSTEYGNIEHNEHYSTSVENNQLSPTQSKSLIT